jgi:acetylornithine deacetylase/succinyl-diaminopimelate desuccinylase-like protein
VPIDRVQERLDALFAIGGGPGANRVGGTEGEQRAHDLAAAWMAEAGLAVEVDEVGNLFGRTREPAVLLGSHLDSVPQGGRFDGALGVVAAIEAVERVGRGAVVAFRSEETGCIGSTAFAAAGPLPSSFLELHVEQGPVLERLGVPLGLVTGVVGIVRGERVFEGPGGHAGTVPMADRRDALAAAAEYILHARATAAAIDGAVTTIGRVEVEPGFGNVIPSRVRLSVDARGPDEERLDRLVAELGLEPTFRLEPVATAPEPREALRAALDERGLPVVELASGAGHDAAVLAAAGVPTGMLFVRSLNGGVSHTPEEESSPEDVALAVDVLTATLRTLAA